MQAQNQEAEDVFPKERLGKKPFIEHHFFPNGAGDHDGVEHQSLENHRPHRQGFALSGDHVAGDQTHTDAKHDELKSRQKALNWRPYGVVTANAFFGCV